MEELDVKLKDKMPFTRFMKVSTKERDGVDELMSLLVQKVNETVTATTVTQEQQ
jgi:GTPase Era involved in 16S rRNA processing